jgi:hypothetical protein
MCEASNQQQPGGKQFVCRLLHAGCLLAFPSAPDGSFPLSHSYMNLRSDTVAVKLLLQEFRFICIIFSVFVFSLRAAFDCVFNLKTLKVHNMF